jgi:hypothetical protein
MTLRSSLRGGVPKPVLLYARGLAMSITHNVPAYGFSIVATAGAVAVTAELHKPTIFHIFLYLLGATAAFTLVGALAAITIEEAHVDDASPQVVFIGSIFSIFSATAGFGAAVLAAHFVHGWFGWFLAAFCATLAYVLVLALEMELAQAIRGSK